MPIIKGSAPQRAFTLCGRSFFCRNKNARCLTTNLLKMKLRAIELFFGIFLLASMTNAHETRQLPRPGPPGSSDFFCPNGKQVTTNCYNTTCPGDQICYAGSTKNVCCPKQHFCPLTGMFSYFDRQDQGSAQVFKYQMTQGKRHFYSEPSRYVDFIPACPFPHPLFFIEKKKADYHDIDVIVSVRVDGYEDVFQVDPLKKCEKNSECGENLFCGDVYNLSNNETLQGRDEQNIRFCYPIPSVPSPYNTTTKYIRLADKQNLVACDSHEDCYETSGDASSFCYKKHEHKSLTYFVKNGGVYEKKVKEGLCMTSRICVDENKPPGVGDFKWELAGAPYSSDNVDGCESDEQCGGGGQTRDSLNPTNIIYNPLCIKDKALSDMSVCCYETIPQCTHGHTETPPISCDPNNHTAGETGFEKCNGKFEVLMEQQDRASRWCDSNTNLCCKHIQNTLQWCDDGETPLFNEPKCSEYDPSVITSGNCEQKGATCKYGHCCPKVTTDPITNNKTIPEYTYVTNYPCIPGGRPPLFKMGFCDPKTERVVIIGEKSSKTGDPLTHFPRDAPTVCVNDIDCSSDNSTLCLYMEPTGKCFYNPMIPLQRSANAVWIGVLITSIVLTFVFLATSICFVVLYRSTSVLDKYMPSGKMGDAKNEGSTSKNSKKSKEEPKKSANQ